MSKDGVLVCNHDIHMQDTTNVAELFPDRAARMGGTISSISRWPS